MPGRLTFSGDAALTSELESALGHDDRDRAVQTLLEGGRPGNTSKDSHLGTCGGKAWVRCTDLVTG